MGVPIPQAELDSLSAACQRLYELDQNRGQHGTDYSLNLQVRPPKLVLLRMELSAELERPSRFVRLNVRMYIFNNDAFR